jgi:hypothetical protein
MPNDVETVGSFRRLCLGALAGAVGTAAMDLVWFARYRRGDGKQGLVAWETAEGLDKWEDASAPGKLGRRVAEALTHRELPDRYARPTTNLVHWTTGLAWGAQYGIVAGSKKRRSWKAGLALGPVVWLTSYVVLPLAGLYKPIWEYDGKTLAKDLSAHMAYGVSAGVTFAALTR